MESTFALTGIPIDTENVTASVPPDVASAQRGDTRAFERLYRQHIGRVFALCVRMTGVKSRAEELAQEIFIKAWKSLPSFRGESSFSTWMHRLAVNHVLFSIRTDKRRDMRVSVVDDVTVYEHSASTPAGDDGMDLENALARLPEGARIVVVLHDVQGYTHEEIGVMLGVTAGTSKAQLHRARRLLRASLEGRAS